MSEITETLENISEQLIDAIYDAEKWRSSLIAKTPFKLRREQLALPPFFLYLFEYNTSHFIQIILI